MLSRGRLLPNSGLKQLCARWGLSAHSRLVGVTGTAAGAEKSGTSRGAAAAS